MLKKCDANWKWRMFAFRVKVVPDFYNQHISKSAIYTLKVNCLHFWFATA